MISAASWATSARTLSRVMFQASAAASARPTANAASIARLNFALSPMPQSLVCLRILLLLHEPSRLGAGQRARHVGADVVLPTPDRGARVGADHAVDPSVVVAQPRQRDLHVPPVGLRHRRLVRQRRAARG